MISCRISWLGHTPIVFETLSPGSSFIPLRVIDEAARWIGHAFSVGPAEQNINGGERYGMLQK